MMETVELINKRLLDYHGKFEDGRALWRIVWSDDEFEKRLVLQTRDGFQLLNPTVQEVPKYSYIKHKYILERLLAVPTINLTELTELTSYEPVWTFQDSNGNALPPVWDAIELIINSVYTASRKVIGAKYKQPEAEQNTPEAMNARINKLQKELFGNETSVGDSLAHDSAVGYGVRNRSDN